MASNPPYTLKVRADWSEAILNHLHHQVKNGEIQLNQFAIDELNINPDDTEAGSEFDRALQGLEDLHLIFYKAKEKRPGGFRRRSLNDVAFSAMLQHDGLRMMLERSHITRTTNLTYSSVIIAGVAVLISFASVLVQLNGKTDRELQQLNTQYQKQLQLLEMMQQSQKGIDASLYRIADSLNR